MITIKPFSLSPNIKHGFFTRKGGVSEGIYTSLNCGFGSGDYIENVNINRNSTLSELGASNTDLLTCNQIHSSRALVVTSPWGADDRPHADAMVTDVRGLALGILTADCAPVLFADPTAGVVGAAHAGWRGALGGILEATVGEMIGLGSLNSNIKVAIGPCIGAGSYEIGPEFRDIFITSSVNNNQFFKPILKKGHHMFDLASYIEHRLLEIGISEIYKTGYDTCQDEDLFFSYRRSVLRGEQGFGRGLSAIALVA